MSNRLESNTETFSRHHDKLVEHYREIGISAVVAAFCIMSDPVVAKDGPPADESCAVLQLENLFD